MTLTNEYEDAVFKREFIRRWAMDGVALGIRRLLKRRKIATQNEFAARIGMQQSAVSRILQAEYAGWTFKTLVRVAEALNARLRIEFDPIEEVDAELEPPSAKPKLSTSADVDATRVHATPAVMPVRVPDAFQDLMEVPLTKWPFESQATSTHVLQ